MESKICAFALGHLNQQFRFNRVAPCFRCQTKIGDISQQVMSEMINSPEAREHRKTLMSGSWPTGCVSCKDFEEAGIRSTRLHGLTDDRFDVPALLAGYDPLDGSVRPTNIKSIELRFGNECNLMCRHCDATFSSRWESYLRANPNAAIELKRDATVWSTQRVDGFYDDIIENIVPHLEHIMFSGGELLYQKRHYQFLQSIPTDYASMISLLYVTNGTITTLDGYDIFELWRRFKDVAVIVSTDGVGRRFEYFRHHAKWHDVSRNIVAFATAGVYTTCEVTTSIYQMFYLPEICDELYGLNPHHMSSSLVQTPIELNVRIIPEEIKARITREWQTYKQNITNPRKLHMVSSVGDMLVDYMNAPNTTSTKWSDFVALSNSMDKIMGTQLRDYCPEIAAVHS